MEVFEAYKSWVRRHADLVSIIESSLSSVTWFLPDRFEGNELVLEGLHTFTNLISVLNESVLRDLDRWAPKGAQELTLALQALQQAEVLVEVCTLYSSKGKGVSLNRYDALILIESLKALVRLGIYRVSGTRLLLQGGSTCFDKFDPSIPSMSGNYVKHQKVLAAFDAFRKRHLPPIVHHTLPEAGGGCTALQIPDSRPQEDYWWEHPKADILNWKDIHANLTRLDSEIRESKGMALRLVAAGEVVHILRPVLYVCCLRIWGARSWKPWIISLICELASYRITCSAQAHSSRRAMEAAEKSTLVNPTISALHAMQGITWNREELDELTRRKMLLLFYLLRDPLFGRVTRPAMHTWLRTTKRVPLVSWLSEKVAEFTEGIQKYYTYTSAS